MIPNGFQCFKNLPKLSKNVRKHDFSDEEIRTPKIDLRPSVGLGKVPTRIFGQFRRHDFSSFFIIFPLIFPIYFLHIRDISGTYPPLSYPRKGGIMVSPSLSSPKRGMMVPASWNGMPVVSGVPQPEWNARRLGD